MTNVGSRAGESQNNMCGAGAGRETQILDLLDSWAPTKHMQICSKQGTYNLEHVKDSG